MKLIIVDDSAVARAVIEQNLKRFEDVSVIASVSNGRRAIDSARLDRPDAVIMDIAMPEMDGTEATKVLAGDMHIPVLVFAADSSAEPLARQAGASDFVEKISFSAYNEVFFKNFHERLQKIIRQNPRQISAKAPASIPSVKGFKVLCIGASTGGPTAVAEVLQGLGRDFPLPVLYVQHIEHGADKTMAEWFDKTCRNMHVKLAQNNEAAKPGTVYMAPADTHLIIDYVTQSGTPVLALSNEVPERFLRPAVNKLFRSAASFYGSACLAILLTGMGRDGAEGCRMIMDKGGYTIAEDKSTCAVFGMPAAAIELGGAAEVLPRQDIATRICTLVKNV